MPNWCDNRVTISSNTEDDSQFKELVAKFQVERPFNEIFPQPDWKTIPNKDGELPVAEEIKNPNGEVITITHNFPDGKNDDRWYDWNVHNWGTKWDIGKDAVEWGDDEEDYFQIHFDTAWAPPEDVASELKRKYKKVSIQWFYDEPGCESAGYL